MEQLQQQLHRVVDSSQHLEQHATQLQQQLQVARADAAELDQQDDVHQAQLYASSSSIAQLQAKVVDTQAQLSAADARTDDLQTQLAKTRLICSELRSQLANAAEQTATSGETHAQLVAEAVQSSQQLADISAQLAASKLRCSELESGVSLQQPAAMKSSAASAVPLVIVVKHVLSALCTTEPSMHVEHVGLGSPKMSKTMSNHSFHQTQTPQTNPKIWH